MHTLFIDRWNRNTDSEYSASLAARRARCNCCMLFRTYSQYGCPLSESRRQGSAVLAQRQKNNGLSLYNIPLQAPSQHSKASAPQCNTRAIYGTGCNGYSVAMAYGSKEHHCHSTYSRRYIQELTPYSLYTTPLRKSLYLYNRTCRTQFLWHITVIHTRDSAKKEEPFYNTQLFNEERGTRKGFAFDNTNCDWSQVARELSCPAGRKQRVLSTEQRGTKSLNVNRSTFNVNRFTLGVVSRLEEIKGMDLVVPAFAKVLKQHPDTRLIVVGDGSLRSAMEQQATEFGCADHITWVGRQPQEELNKWYNQMDIVLMPSRSEGFGLTAIEAMSNGCVMVASNVGGLPEVVRDGVCGLLHRSEDIKDMADKISLLISDEDKYKSLQAQSLSEVEKYSFERYAELMNDLYNKCRV